MQSRQAALQCAPLHYALQTPGQGFFKRGDAQAGGFARQGQEDGLIQGIQR